MKKYAWIVALLLALTFTFIGCGADPIPPDPNEETFTDIDLVEFNWLGGQPENQKGFATDDQDGITKKMGYKLEDFQKAKYLVLELKEGGIKGGLFIQFGIDTATGSALGLSNPGWNETRVAEDDGSPVPVKTKLDGNTLKIALPQLVRYDAFSSSDVKFLKIVVSYYQGVDNLVEKAYLQISNQPLPFVAATSIVVNDVPGAIARTSIPLSAAITPADASVQSPTWEIVGGSLYYPGEVDFVISADGKTKSGNAIKVNPTTGGTVKVRAILKNGGEDGAGNKIDIVSAPVTITVGANSYYGSPAAFEFKVNAVVKTADTLGIVGGYVGTDHSNPAKFFAKLDGNFGNSYPKFQLDLGTEKLQAYKGVKFRIRKQITTADYKNVYVQAVKDEPNSYFDITASNIGASSSSYSTQVSGTGSITTETFPVDIEFGVGNGVSSAGFDAVKGESKVWIVIHYHDDITSFTISDLEFYK
jgi:hypothetical protein